MGMTDAEELPGTWDMLDHDELVLTPMPTDSPNDPLNWHWARRAWNGLLCCYLAGLTAATSNDAGSGQAGMESQLGISYSYANTAAGVLFATIALSTFFTAPLPWLYGRKCIYLMSMLSGLAGAVWFAKIQSPSDSIWNQLFVGASESCAEANVQLSLTDVSFDHQRGTALGWYVLATSVGTYIGPLIASFIADDTTFGWRWIGWWAVIISAATFVVLFFGMEETMFERTPMLPVAQPEQPSADAPSLAQSGKPEPGHKHKHEHEHEYESDKNMGSHSSLEKDKSIKDATVSPTVLESGALAPESGSRAHEPRKTYWQRVQPITCASNLKGTGFKQYCKRMLLTARMLVFPAILFSGLQWGAQDAWLSFYLTLEEDDWVDAPWNYGDAADGIMNVPCLIGAVLGCIYGGWMNDKFVIWLAHRRRGHREAEDRLWFMIPTAFVSCAGMLLFGIGTARGWAWGAPYVGLAFLGFGFGCCGDLSMTYVAEAYPECVMEGMCILARPCSLCLGSGSG